MPGGGKNYDHGMRVDQEVFLSYFSPEGARCDTCNQPVNLWECIQETLTGWSLPGMPRTREPLMFTANALGLPSTAFKIELSPDSAVQVKLDEYGVPPQAKILSINFTLQGGRLFPAEIKQQRVLGEPLPHVLTLHPLARPDGSAEATILNVWVLWIGESFVAPSFIHVVDALIHYTHDEFAKCVRSAQLAIEEPLKDLVQRAFDAKGALPRTVERLLARRPHYEIVDSILPVLAEDLDLPPIPPHLLKGIKKLAELRNRSSHRASAVIQEGEARDGLVSSLFGLYYALFFDSLLMAG